MAATLVLHQSAKILIVNALKEDLTLTFLAKETANVSLDQTLETGITSLSSDGSVRYKQLRIGETSIQYETYNDLVQLDENRITNFYIVNGTAVNRLVLMNSATTVRGIITFPTITPTETKSLYVPQIKINVL